MPTLMHGDPIDQFELTLESIDVGCTRTTTDGFSSAATEAIESPAIGSSLRVEGLSLSDVPVELEPTAADIEAAATGITVGAHAIASYGSVLIESTTDGDELISLFPPKQIAVVPASRISGSMSAAFEWLKDAFDAGRDSFVFVTGTSATADMGATVEGVHGPEAVHVIIVEDR